MSIALGAGDGGGGVDCFGSSISSISMQSVEDETFPRRRSISCGLAPETGKFLRFSSSFKSLTFMSSYLGGSVEDVTVGVGCGGDGGAGVGLVVTTRVAVGTSFEGFCDAGKIICGYLCCHSSCHCRNNCCCCSRSSYEVSLELLFRF